MGIFNNIIETKKYFLGISILGKEIFVQIIGTKVPFKPPKKKSFKGCSCEVSNSGRIVLLRENGSIAFTAECRQNEEVFILDSEHK